MVVEIVRGVYKNMIVASKYSYSYNQIVRTNNLLTFNILLDYLLRYLDFLISWVGWTNKCPSYKIWINFEISETIAIIINWKKNYIIYKFGIQHL